MIELVYSEVKETSADGTVTTLNDGTEIHWIINPNQDGVYQQKLEKNILWILTKYQILDTS